MAQLPEGLVAIGGELSPRTVVDQYRRGVFPWYSDDQPVLWWCPDPRLVFPGCAVHVSRRLRRRLARGEFAFTLDRAFERVIDGCAAPRAGADGTWITAEMRAVYLALHDEGRAHSMEVWRDDVLVGGVYGVALGRVFFGESMFSHVTDASKAGFATLAAYLRRRGFALIDAQVENAHLLRLGGQRWERRAFLAALQTLAAPPDPAGRWNLP